MELENEINNPVDDQGTTQTEAASLMRSVLDNAFAGDSERLALALGRNKEQVEAWLSNNETIDYDAAMKARGIAQERNIELDD